MANAFADNPRVHIDTSLSSKDAFHATNNTFDGISDLGDFMGNIPYITLAISTAKNIKSINQGNKNISDAIEHIALDTTGVGFGGYAGSQIGLSIGLALSPVTGGSSVIVIPLITSIIGTIIGIFAGRSVTNWFKERHLRSLLDKLNNMSTEFVKLFLKKFDNIISTITIINNNQINKIKFSFKNSGNLIKRIFFPSIMSKFYSMANLRVKDEFNNSIEFYDKLKDNLSEMSYKEGGIILYSQGKAILVGDIDLTESWNSIDKKIKEIEKEKKRIS